ncbi:hypothetical protein [Clostridium felsineum]|uniref:hypothetical protein n=1 Tax=Clostridium felsineum TaxID=36839 RepID=UPI0009CF18C6|nr:hypothetical protein CLFE_045770 [Clostridium felsineum DSM 794]
MNMKLFRLINNLSNKNSILHKLMIFFSKDVPYIFMFIVAVVFILGVIKKNDNYRKVYVNTFIMTVINLMLSFLI